MRDLGDNPPNLSGNLLIAHPGLLDPNFKRSVILISAHTVDNGALGVVINRPLNKTLGDLRSEFAISPLAEVPLFYGGPVNNEQMILSAWNWDEKNQSFKLYFGITADKVEALIFKEPNIEVRGFMGHAGWTECQLEGELKQNAWEVSALDGNILKNSSGINLWKKLLTNISPELKLLADAPDDPSIN